MSTIIQIIITEEALQETFDNAFEKALNKALNKLRSDEPNNKPLSPATRIEGSEFLGLSLPTFDTLLRTNQIKSFRIGRQVRINWSELEAYLEKKGADPKETYQLKNIGDKDIRDLNISMRALNCLKGQGVFTVSGAVELFKKTGGKRIRNFGNVSRIEVRKELEKIGAL